MSDYIYENPNAPRPEYRQEGIAEPIYFGEKRFVGLNNPAYYVPENPHTDDVGRLPHDGGPMPEHVRGKRVDVVSRCGAVIKNLRPGALPWTQNTGRHDDIIAYRIVGEGSEGRERNQGTTINADEIVSWAEHIVFEINMPCQPDNVTEREVFLAEAILKARAMLDQENGHE